jgi:DNA-binding MarR family transcriptional regulator
MREASSPDPQSTEPGRFAYSGLDRVLHEKARVAIMTSLMRYPAGILFNDLKKLCSLTDGNLNRHVEVLHREGLVEVWKNHEGKRPQTLFRVTAKGKQQFLEYLEELERLVQDALPAKKSHLTQAPPRGWVMGM